MPWQLIYTSAPRGLTSGQSGFCIVARSAGLREGLVQRLEQFSAYQHLKAATAGAGVNPVIAACRIVDLRGARYYVLTRIRDAGLDFTARTNHVAHHLVFEPSELFELPSPAVILRDWDGWRRRWDEPPRLIEDDELGNLRALADTPLPAQAWLDATGDSGRAAALLEPELAQGCHLVGPPGDEERLLDLFAETLQILNADGRSPGKAWQFPFTTFLQESDDAADFRWRGGWRDAASQETTRRRAGPVVAPAALAVPVNALAQLARQGAPRSAVAHKPSAVAPVLAGVRAATPAARSTPRRGPAPGAPSPADWPEADAPGTAGDEGWRAFFTSRTNVILVAVTGVLLAVLLGGLLVRWFRGSPPSTPGLPEKPASASVVTSPVPSGASPPLGGTPTPAPDARPAATNPPGNAATSALPVLPAEGKSPPAPAESRPVRPTEARLAELLDAQLPNWPTLVVMLPQPTIESLALPASPDLEHLLSAVLRQNQHGFLECLVQGGAFAVSRTAPGVRASLRSELARKWLEAEGGGARVRLEFEEWARQSEGQAVGMSCAMPSDTGVVSLLFRNLPGRQPEAGPFRLLLLRPGRKAEPIRLDTGLFVQVGATNYAQWFAPTLQRRLDQLKFASGLRTALRLQVRGAGGALEDLFHNWPEGDRPAPGEELDFAGLTRRLADSVVQGSKDLEAAQRELLRPGARERGRERERRAELQAAMAQLEKRLTALNDRIKRVPKTPDRLARVSLLIVGGPEPMEFIRFTSPVEGGRP